MAKAWGWQGRSTKSTSVVSAAEGGPEGGIWGRGVTVERRRAEAGAGAAVLTRSREALSSIVGGRRTGRINQAYGSTSAG